MALPQLKLFLDADCLDTTSNGSSELGCNFNVPADDDSETFVPGANHSDAPGVLAGDSFPLPTAVTPIQRVRVIAAYVDASGQIVAPPSAQPVSVTLNDPATGQSTSSAFDGIAMNAPDPRGSGADFELESGSSSWTNNTARVWLRVWDYGGAVTIHVSHAGTAAVPLSLPRDPLGNWIPDAGWTSGGTSVGDAGAASDDMDPLPSANVGDGITRFEEYRGFVVQGQHVRTRPDVADLFVQSNLPEGAGFAPALPFTVRELWITEIDTDRSITHFFGNTGAGGQPPGHYVNPLRNLPHQKAIQLVDSGFNTSSPGVVGETEPIVPGAVTPSNILPLRIYVQSIRFVSPTVNDLTTPDLVDPDKTKQTLAHEIGHGINLADFQTGGVCVPPRWTVMVTDYFTQSTVMTCAWSNIPAVYHQDDFPPLTLR